MKNIRPIYVYGFGVIICALVFIFLSKKDNTVPANNSGSTVESQMPNDNIHKGLNDASGQPNKSNVAESVMQKMQMLKQEAEKNPRDTANLKAYADFLSAAHQPDQALEYYNKILSMYPKRIDVLFSAAYLNYMNRNFSGAESDLNKIITYDKNNLQAYYNLGAVAASAGNKNKAKEIWSKLVKDHPDAQIAGIAKKSLQEI